MDRIDGEIVGDGKAVDKIFYSAIYNRFLRKIIADYKFNNKSYLYVPLGEILISTIDRLKIIERENIDLIGYIPSHRSKECRRGYNQGGLLAEYIGKKKNIKVLEENLVKVKVTREQNKLNKRSRLTNLEDSFIVRRPKEIEGKNILLIDDIVTTGSTFNQVGGTLKSNKSGQIICLALTSSRRI